MKKKLLSLIVCLLLLAPTLALGAARLPAERGTVTDDADVLSAQTASDIAEYAEKLDDETDMKVHVAIVHFLDGMDAQSYANALFEKWRLGSDDLLIVGAAGEDSFATAMGSDVKKILGEKNAENLMFTSSTFSTLFRRQQYDAAFGAYFTALNTLVEKQTGERIKLGKLFSASQTQQTTTSSTGSYGSQLWSEVMTAIQGSTEDYQQYHESREHSGNGIGVGGWLVLAVLILLIFGQSDPVRRARRGGRGNYRTYGCGCSPLGWIISLFGINVLIDTLRGRR